MLILVLLLLAICSLTAITLTRSASDDDAAAFAAAYAVPPTEQNVELLRTTLQRSRRFRRIGGLLVVVPGVILASSAGFWTIVVLFAAGFAAGSLTDELTRPRPRPARQTASLERRSVSTYVEPWVLGVLALTAVAAAAQIASALRLTPGGEWFVYAPGPSVGRWVTSMPSQRVIIALGGAAVAVVVLGAVMLRRLVRVPAPVEPPEQAAVQHAIRSATVVSVVCAMTTMLGVIAVHLANATALADGTESRQFQWLNNISLFVGFGGTIVGVVLSWWAFPRSPLFRRAAAGCPPRTVGSS